MKGKLYESWLAILQNFNFQIHYLHGGQIAVPDTLSRCNPEASPQSSPEVIDAFFPYVQETPTGVIELPGGVQLRDLIGSSQGCNHLNVDDGYDVDTDDFDICPVPVTSPQAANGPVSGPSVGAINESSQPDGGLPETTPEPELDVTALLNRSPTTSSDCTSLPETTVIDTLAQQARSIELFRKCDFSPSSIAELQKADPKLQSFVEYLQDGTLPVTETEPKILARSFWLPASRRTTLPL